MSGGLAALLDDVATMAKMAAASIDDVGLAAGRASAKSELASHAPPSQPGHTGGASRDRRGRGRSRRSR